MRELIERMHDDEFLTVKEIASALHIDPTYVYEVIYKD